MHRYARVSGTMPPQLVNLSSLAVFGIDNNALSGTVPKVSMGLRS